MKNLFLYLIIGIFLVAFYVWRYRTAPAIEVTEINVKTNGAPASLVEIEQGNLLVNYYARWCGECMAEMSALQALHASGKVKVVALTDDSLEEIASVRKKFKITFPIYQLVGTLKDEGVYTIPASYLINTKGETVKRFLGAENWVSEEMMNNYAAWLSLQ
ncbi:MAG: thiol-disulfide isomerase/thioredoxin [Flavobacteriales bacterium]|jgi:thiol-disulfide isomerase/thioredoxin